MTKRYDVKSVKERGCFTHAKRYQNEEDFSKTSGLKLVEIDLNLVPFGSDMYFSAILKSTKRANISLWTILDYDDGSWDQMVSFGINRQLLILSKESNMAGSFNADVLLGAIDMLQKGNSTEVTDPGARNVEYIDDLS